MGIYAITGATKGIGAGPALAMLVLPEMKGVSGAVLYCDGGTSSFLHPERFY